MGVGPVSDFVAKTINTRDDWAGHLAVLKRNSIRLRKLI